MILVVKFNYLLIFSQTMTYYCSLLLFFLLIFTTAEGLGESCTKNSDCKIKGSVCVNGGCNCDVLSYYNNNQCLPYATEYNAICYETAQCEWLGDNAECKNNRCGCRKTFRWYKGKCQAYVDKGEKCDSDNDCYNGYDLLSLTCSEGVCTCSEGYYDRGHDCRKSSTLSSDCALNIDCKNTSVPLICTLGKCSLSSVEDYSHILNYEINDETEVKEPAISTDVEEVISCANDNDCRDMTNSLCDVAKGICGCKEETHYFYNGNCVPGLSYCDTFDDCTVDNTMCFKNTCVCKQGFFLRENQCIAELGMHDTNIEYENDSQCPIKPGKLVNSACFCRDYWFNDDGNRNCIKTMIQYTKSCLTNEWCNAMGPYSFCNSDTAKCECVKSAALNEITYYCDLFEPYSADACLRDKDCSLNERCLDGTCECIEQFSKNADSNTCLPNVGGLCETAGCSHIEHSTCAGGFCKCDSNYIGKVNKCLKTADHLFDGCEEVEQCRYVEHSVCGVSEEDDYDDESEKCVCEDGYTAISEKCYQSRKYGDPCITQSDCTLVLNRSYKCRNSICQCDVGEKLKNGYCTSFGSSISGNYQLLLMVLIFLKLTLY